MGLQRRRRIAAPPKLSRGAELLLDWRTTSVLDQTDAARQINIDVAAYCKLETGYRRPGLSRAVDIQTKTKGHVPATSWMFPCSPAYRQMRRKKAA
jgi:hypothetical protein